jgi:hypothetical protein
MGGHLSASHSFIHLLLGKHLLYARHCPRVVPTPTNSQTATVLCWTVVGTERSTSGAGGGGVL